MFISTYCIKFWNVKFVWHLKCFCIHISDVWFFVEPTKNRTLFMDVPYPNCFLKNEVWRTFKVDFSLRDHPFKTSAKFYAIIDPSPPQCIHMEVKVAVWMQSVKVATKKSDFFWSKTCSLCYLVYAWKTIYINFLFMQFWVDWWPFYPTGLGRLNKLRLHFLAFHYVRTPLVCTFYVVNLAFFWPTTHP